MQFWYEESEQGRRFHRTLERMRGRIYEDDSTGLPNSRHFVFELRRQMMRSVRNGRGFSLVLTDLGGCGKRKRQRGPHPPRHLQGPPPVASAKSDFVAHLQGAIFAAIITDDRDRSAAEKADGLLTAHRLLHPARPRRRRLPRRLVHAATKANSKCATSCAAPSATCSAPAPSA